MVVSIQEKLSFYAMIKDAISEYTFEQIEDGIMSFGLLNYGFNPGKYLYTESEAIVSTLKRHKMPHDFETIIGFYEFLIDDDNKNENGIVFTPKYISDFICETTFKNLNLNNPQLSIIDPGCGCGIFLVSAAEYLYAHSYGSMDSIIENNIFGIDIDCDNVRRCDLVLRLLSAKYGGDYINVKPNILCMDSLKTNWCAVFSVTAFSAIIGNPPYVNPHDMCKETVKFLKNTFSTTQKGVFNIFYAFIEKAMPFLADDGYLGYIIPNNFLTIKSAFELRSFMKNNKLLHKLLDFSDNMVFKPIRTYNCILILNKTASENFEYAVLSKTDSIESDLKNISWQEKNINSLDNNGWILTDEKTSRNIKIIESQAVCIKDFIRTGIATLRDNVYLVEQDKNGYYKMVNSTKMYIESTIVKTIYKIPELKKASNANDVKRYIIFPYYKRDNGYSIISENELKENYPNTYKYLCTQRELLDSRDKGKGNSQGWYAYGRTQGLNKYGKKLLFPTFSNSPKFTYIDNDMALFCNGYAVFENGKYALDILQKILNSSLMEYYIKNTSYSIEGGYYCYQKKYIEKFSLPKLTERDIKYIRNSSPEEINVFLANLYGIEI